jgi:ATP-dependent Lon protease
LDDVKEELLLFCMDRLMPHTFPGASRPVTNGRILALEGSPGVGKTHLIKTLARCWGLPFHSIAVGGCKDSAFFDGHTRTYEGAIPGRIVHALREVRVMNPLIYMDELDKLSESNHGQEVSAQLLHILDETQNGDFHDKYIGEVPIDLSGVFWVLSINDREKIDPVLRNRLYIVKIPDPEVSDKVETAERIMLPGAVLGEHQNQQGKRHAQDETTP